MYRGHILAEGSLEELRDRHHERDLEELFFQLISQHDAQDGKPESRGFFGNGPHFVEPLPKSVSSHF